MIDGEVDLRKSGPGIRANLPVNGEIVVSLWEAAPEVDLVAKAHSENIIRMQKADRHEHELAQALAAQQRAEYRKIRARA